MGKVSGRRESNVWYDLGGGGETGKKMRKLRG